MSDKLKSVAFISKNPDDAKGLAEVLAKLPGTKLSQHTGTLSELNGSSADLAAEHDIIIFRAEEATENDVEAIREIKKRAGESAPLVAVTGEDTSLADVRKLTRAGVAEVVPDSMTPAEFKELIESRTLKALVPISSFAAPAMGKVITVTEARGGIGSTLVAVNVADQLLARKGLLHKEAQNRVALVDLDIQFGAVSTFLDVPPSNAFFDLAMEGFDPDETFVSQSLVKASSGLSVLPAPLQFVPLDAIKAKQIGKLLHVLQRSFDYIVIDLPRTLVDWVGPVLQATDRMLMVTDSSVPSIRQARRLIDFYTEENLSLPIDIVINQEKKPVIKARHHTEAEKVLERQFKYWIPFEPKPARDSIDRGQPLSQVAGRSAISKSIKRLAVSTMAKIQSEHQHHDSTAG